MLPYNVTNGRTGTVCRVVVLTGADAHRCGPLARRAGLMDLVDAPALGVRRLDSVAAGARFAVYFMLVVYRGGGESAIYDCLFIPEQKRGQFSLSKLINEMIHQTSAGSARTV